MKKKVQKCWFFHWNNLATPRTTLGIALFFLIFGALWYGMDGMNHFMREGVVRNAENKRQFVNLLLILLAMIFFKSKTFRSSNHTSDSPSTYKKSIESIHFFKSYLLTLYDNIFCFQLSSISLPNQMCILKSKRFTNGRGCCIE